MTNKLLNIISTLNEFKTGKQCTASVHFGFVLGVGYISVVEDNAVTEIYIFPFTVVKITTYI
jgi:hypothetical protein